LSKGNEFQLEGIKPIPLGAKDYPEAIPEGNFC
jgi:hypothetical protein